MAERIEAVPVPAEPSEFSVVIDRDGFAWQRVGARWFRVIRVLILIPGSDGYRDWPNLLWDHGPLDVVHRGPDPAPEESAP